MNTVFEKILSFFMGVMMMFSYAGSFLCCNIDETFEITTGEFSENTVFFNGKDAQILTDSSFSANKLILNKSTSFSFKDGSCDFFNYYALSYKTDAFIKGTVKYEKSGETAVEDFFLSPTQNEFFSFIDGYLQKEKANKIISFEFTSLDKDEAFLEISGISTFNRKIEDEVVYSENEFLKMGINLKYGGALSYLEDLDSNVEVVKKDGKIKVDSDAAKRYKTIPVNKKVNLINCYDAGRLVQQSYYGTFEGGYIGGEFMDSKWNYNPVQGGNKFDESSKIVDLRVSKNSVYIKCRPLDWALGKEHITPSYMEATYTLDGKNLNVSCSFVDFSGYPATVTTQEMPAFYCIEPFNNFYYYDGELKCKDDLIFWPDAGYPHFNSKENWIAFSGEFSDSFGIGLFVPNETDFLAGIFNPGKTKETNPCYDSATSYVALIRSMEFKSFSPISYNYSITTGTVEEIRETFKNM